MPFPLTNLLLESLPSLQRIAMMAHLEPVDLPLRTVLFEAEQVPKYVYFMTSGIGSVVTPMLGGNEVEVGLIGREGFPGSFFLLGEQTGATRSFVQVPATGLRMRYQQFQGEFLQNPQVRGRVLQFVQHEALVLSQLSACNRLHEVEERLARWLLMVSDRTGTLELPLTQEFIAGMLGTRRSTVTVVAGTLQRAGLIEHSRGWVRILNRENLESGACECYSLIRKLRDDLYRKPVLQSPR